MSLNVARSSSPLVNFTYSHEHQRYNVASTYGELVKIDAAAGVYVKFMPDHDLLIVRRGFGSPAAVVAGTADVIIGLDAAGRIVNIEIEFADYYHQHKEDARQILKTAKW